MSRHLSVVDNGTQVAIFPFVMLSNWRFCWHLVSEIVAFWETAPSGERRCTIWNDYNLNESDNVMKRVQLQNITMLYLSPHRTVIKNRTCIPNKHERLNQYRGPTLNRHWFNVSSLLGCSSLLSLFITPPTLHFQPHCTLAVEFILSVYFNLYIYLLNFSCFIINVVIIFNCWSLFYFKHVLPIAAVRRWKTVSAYFTSEQILPLASAGQHGTVYLYKQEKMLV